jgi:flagellar motor protein MotB
MAEHPSDKDPGEVTQHILRELGHQHRSGGHSAPKHDEHDPDEHEEHIDERWLVSYADMMTLLFGLFVMLYAMAPQMEQVKQSVAETFTQEQKPPQTPPPEQLTLKEGEVPIQKTELERLTALAATAERLEIENTQLRAEKAQMAEEIVRLKAEIERLEEELRRRPPPLAAKPPEQRKPAEKPAPPVEDLRPTVKRLEGEKLSLEKRVQDLLEELKKKKYETITGDTQFMAFMMTWNTKEHAIDLIVEDPSGKKFDFKRRSYPNHPGLFTMDTKKGPGASLWQSEKILTGRYKVTYAFYNTYGNKEPAKVLGTIYTQKGKFELPLQTLEFGKRNKSTLEFEVSESGKIELR